MKLVIDYTKEEYLALENKEPNGYFSQVIIVPTDKIHDSGYRCMKYILCEKNEIVGVIGGWSDVLHLNGIGGYGRNFNETIDTKKTDVIDWKIDCLPISGCLHLFANRKLSTDKWCGSDMCIYNEGRKGVN